MVGIVAANGFELVDAQIIEMVRCLTQSSLRIYINSETEEPNNFIGRNTHTNTPSKYEGKL